MPHVVVFGNNGEMDLRAIKSFGVSAKDNANPIGYFGTGLKYAISILLRTKHKLRVCIGEKEYLFDTRRETMRGKEFDFITMNGEELPFTTELGKNWNVTQAFRELYCNALDEGGGVVVEAYAGRPRAGCTRIEVSGPEIEKIYDVRDQIVLRLSENLLVSDDPQVQIYDKPSAHIYYRGIAVGNLRAGSRYTYNILQHMTLTEDRTLKHDWIAEQELTKAVTRLTDKVVIRRIICPEKESFESTLNYLNAVPYASHASTQFVDVVGDEYSRSNKRMNQTVLQILKARKPKAEMEEEYKPVELSDIEKQMLKRALFAVGKIYPDIADFNLVVVRSLGEDIMGLAEVQDRKIILSKSAFPLGTKYVASTLLEEYIHITTNKRDLTRALQTHLFDLVMSLVEEHVIKEPI